MIEELLNKNILFLQNHGIKMNNCNDKEIYKYGLRILYLYLIDVSVIFAIAFCFNKLYETVIITFTFAILQAFGGGYHAKTPIRCLLIMLAGAFIGNILIVLTTNMIIFNITVMLIVNGFILMKTPVININHPVSKKVHKKSRLMIKFTIVIIFAMYFLLTILNRNIEKTALVAALELYFLSLIYVVNDKDEFKVHYTSI